MFWLLGSTGGGINKDCICRVDDKRIVMRTPPVPFFSICVFSFAYLLGSAVEGEMGG